MVIVIHVIMTHPVWLSSSGDKFKEIHDFALVSLELTLGSAW